MKQIIFVLLIISSFSCNNSPTPPEESGQFSLAGFPTSVGSSWTYFTYDSLAHSADSLVVTILNNISVSDSQIIQRWQFKSKMNIDTLIISAYADTALFLDKTSYPVWNMTPKLVFPLTVGKGWICPLPGDTVFVAEYSVISVPAGNFYFAYRLEESWRGLNVFGHTTTWFVPQVGIVWLHHIETDLSSANLLWQLRSYHIVK